jgi:hypothetical protein
MQQWTKIILDNRRHVLASTILAHLEFPLTVSKTPRNCTHLPPPHEQGHVDSSLK